MPVLISAIPVKNAKGEFVAGIEIIQDITALKEKENQIKGQLEYNTAAGSQAGRAASRPSPGAT